SDVPIYDELFDIFFTGVGEVVRQTAAAAGQGDPMSLSEEEMRDLLEKLAELLKNANLGISELAKALAMQDAGEMERILRELMESGKLPKTETNYVPPGANRQMMQMLGAADIPSEFERILDLAREQGESEA